MRALLTEMATHESVTAVLTELTDVIERDFSREIEESQMFREPEEEIKWDLEGELVDFAKHGPKELWTQLGFDYENGEPPVIPGMAKVHDPEKVYSTWTEEGRAALAKMKDRKTLHWHQLVGLTRMAEWLMTGKSGMSLDEVGLGKTLTAISLLAYRSALIAGKDNKGQYLGKFGE
jgi:SNF2 family DNA or RNA helicase